MRSDFSLNPSGRKKRTAYSPYKEKTVINGAKILGKGHIQVRTRNDADKKAH